MVGCRVWGLGSEVQGVKVEYLVEHGAEAGLAACHFTHGIHLMFGVGVQGLWFEFLGARFGLGGKVGFGLYP